MHIIKLQIKSIKNFCEVVFLTFRRDLKWSIPGQSVPQNSNRALVTPDIPLFMAIMVDRYASIFFAKTWKAFFWKKLKNNIKSNGFPRIIIIQCSYIILTKWIYKKNIGLSKHVNFYNNLPLGCRTLQPYLLGKCFLYPSYESCEFSLDYYDSLWRHRQSTSQCSEFQSSFHARLLRSHSV